MKGRHLSAYRMIEVWKQKSKHLNPNQEVIGAINNWLAALQEMEEEDDRVTEEENRDAQDTTGAAYQYGLDTDNDDIPF